MAILLTIHSITRWLVTLAALALLYRLIMGLIRKQTFDKNTTVLTNVFGGLMDTQLLLGVMFFILDGLGKTGFPPYRWEHATTMLLAVITAHFPALWKMKADSLRTRNTLIVVVISLLLVFAGIGPLGGWVRWWHITGLF